jgi:hypothetical protein
VAKILLEYMRNHPPKDGEFKIEDVNEKLKNLHCID